MKKPALFSRRLHRFGGEQAFQSRMPDDDARDVKPRLLDEAGAQMNVMPQIIDAQLQIFESDRRCVAGQAGGRRLA